MKTSTFSIISIIIFCLASGSSAKATVHKSDLPAHEGSSTGRLSHSSYETLGGFDELVPYVIASPDQEDAGSCLYMAITGIAEWWLARLNPTVSRAPDGPLDLSERYIMNVAGIEENETQLKNWRTDAIYLFNQNKNKTLTNQAYRFTKGWFIGESYSDHLTPAKEGTPGAEYGTLYNWIDQRPKNPSNYVELPQFERTVIFADPSENQWNVGIAPDTIAEQVKDVLRTRKAPVLVLYNQNSYWHAVYIVGYNDEIDNGNCAYLESFRKRIVSRAEELEKKAKEATDPVVKDAYEIRALRAREAHVKIEKAYVEKKGCSSSKGVFYIRDSIYPDVNGPKYDYDLSRTGDEAHYSKKIVFKEYDWLKYFANHISVIYPAGH